MNDSSDRLERVKEALAQSYARVRDEDREPLPSAAREILEKLEMPVQQREASWWQRLHRFFQGPQLIGLGAAAMLVVAAVIMLPRGTVEPGITRGGGGQTMRSGDDTREASLLVILKDLDPTQVQAIRESGYFRDQQIFEMTSGGNLEKYRDRQLVLVDGASGEISTPFAELPIKESFSTKDPELASLILDIIAELPSATE
jgi:hypothetical protein